MHSTKFILPLLLVIIATTDLFAQNTFELSKTKDQRVKNTYGFLLGQEYSINLVKTKFPDLSISATLAEATFDASFGTSKEKIKSYLIHSMGDSLFKVYFDAVLLEAKKLFNKIEFTNDIAVALIADINKRAEGQIPTPTLETLLAFKFSDKPEKEFSAGFVQAFKTKGHTKAKGTDWQIKVPKSWRAREGERPNIIQKFTSDYGDGNQSIILIVKELDLPKGYKITKRELDEMFSEKEMKKMVDEDSKFISFTKMTLDSHAGGMLEFEQILSRLDFQIKIRMLSFIFIRNNKMYFLQGTVSTDNLKENLSLQMKKFLPLYKLVANSIIVNDQY